MGLTEKQRESIQQNRDRALELRKRKLDDEAATVGTYKTRDEKSEGDEPAAVRRRIVGASGKKAVEENKAVLQEDDDEVELEAFEEGASGYITKQEAMKMYCLPVGTLEVCSFIEKPNPRNGAWNAMKLYDRCEIRRRARKRFGGLEGLMLERRKREEARFKNDMEKTKDVFR